MMKLGVIATAVVILAVILSPSSARAGAPSDAALDALFADYWAFEMAENPFAATIAGVHEYNDRAPAVAPEDFARRNGARDAFAQRLEAIDRASASADAALSAQLLEFILKHENALSVFDRWRMPFNADSGFHTLLTHAFQAAPLKTKQDRADYLARLAALPAYLDQEIANMRRGLADGFAQPAEIMPFVLPSFDALAARSAEDHPLFKPLKEIDDEAFRNKARALLDREVIPAFARLAAFIRNEYAPGGVKAVGADKLPGGADYYAALVRYYTTLDDATAEDIHALGLREVARIRKEMAGVIREAGFDGSFEDFQTFLRSDPQFYAETPEALLKEAAFIAKEIDGRLPAFFGRLPRQPYSVAPVPAEIAPNYTTGRYVGAPADAPRGGLYWVNTYALDTRPLYELPALTLHEAVPGHHLQIALSLEIENAPAFRKEFYAHAFGEGWGLYSEKLGVEMGVYKTPYDDFGRLSMEMWRACRLVIDTGVHAKGWTRDEALDYLAANTVLSLHNVRTEVDRYITWPGQALAYKVGELTIWELREKAEMALGDRFDIRSFHDAVLVEGALPLDILRARIDAYIERARTGKQD